jgi:[acyl-carrier-protein] S-malonyltransferase
LSAERIPARLLSVPRPYHTPLMEPVQHRLAEALEPISFRPPSLPFLSSVTNRFVTDPGVIRANLVTQIAKPVRYVDLIEQLADRGVRAVVEVGPRRVLTGLHRKILAGRDVVSVACDPPARPGLSGLLAVQARLDSLGLLSDQTRS